ncbi:MAG: hypothetical protein MUE85_03550 [Microscillaceae bacterium]|nr:hypothetical protein [Microscillaceae bacterium]
MEYSFSVLKAQEANNLEFAEIYIYRFKAKSEDVFTLFFNRKEVLKMASGGRLLYRLRSEGSITVTAIAGTSYQEPSSRDKNYRSFTVEKGKSYYLEISGSKTAEITYVLSQISGKRNFEDDKKFVGDVIKQEENINDPIPSLSIEKNIVKFKEMVNKAKVEIAQKEKEIKKKINDYFEDLKKRAKLAREVSPNVNVNVEEDGMYGGRMRYNLRATYSYEVDEGGVKAELAHYPSGKYQLPTSPAALATTQAMKETIEYYLAEYFEPGGIVNVRVTGSADAIPIRNPYFYLGEYNEIADQDYYLASSYETISKGVQIDSAKVGKKDGAAEAKSSAPAFIENSPKKAISLKKGDKITQNEQLAFLRTMGIRYFVENDIAPLQRTKNQFIHRGKVEGSGSKYRKVIIELAIQDIFRNK